MKEFIINQNDSDQRLDKFITKVAPLLPPTMMYKAIRTKNIKVNRKRAEISTRLAVGDLVQIYIKDEFLQGVEAEKEFLHAPPNIDIVYQDQHLLLVNKPVGLVVHSDESGGFDTLINRITHYLYQQQEYSPDTEQSFAPALCNRIDRNTTGIVICAKDAATLRLINQKIKDREITKQYRCLVFGKPSPKEKLCKAFLRKDDSKNQVEIFPHPVENGRTVITEYKVIKSVDDISLLNVVLHTGRTHQIRAHMAYLGHPLVGDTKYGHRGDNKNLPFRFQALCAYSLTFDFTTDSAHLAYLQGKEFKIDANLLEQLAK